MSTAPGEHLNATFWKSGAGHWFTLSLATVALAIAFFDPLRFMEANWSMVEEYSYGYFIPVITAFLIWQRSDRLRTLPLTGSWSGLLLVAAGLLLLLVGNLSAIRLFGQYGFVVAVFGVSACTIGWRGTRLIAMPLAMLVFMIPLPQFLLREISASLQLVSSEIGVALIRGFGISVFLEGNVIDLGSYQLQVVEACSGLRYLFPLMVLGFLAAYFFQGAMWKRVLIVVSTVPLTIAINSLRIGVIGITVEYWGTEMAEGLLHDFEGFFMFMLCLLLLVGEMTLLARLGSRGQPLRSVFGMDLPEPAAPGAPVTLRRIQATALAGGLLLGAFAAYGWLSPERQQVAPARTSFAAFPLKLEGGWLGRADHLAPDVLATLALDDYLLVNYARPGEPPVNLYSAYYAEQSGGQSSHSPRTCIPGGGFSISQITALMVQPAAPEGSSAGSLPAVPVNRAIIQKGEQRQLVYYWFRQRGRVLTDEFTVKWHILHDGIVHNRSDGALLRLVTPIAPGEDEAQADRRLVAFMTPLEARLGAYVPD